MYDVITDTSVFGPRECNSLSFKPVLPWQNGGHQAHMYTALSVLSMDVSDAKHADPYTANRILRAKLRAVKSGDAALEKRRWSLGGGGGDHSCCACARSRCCQIDVCSYIIRFGIGEPFPERAEALTAGKCSGKLSLLSSALSAWAPKAS
eukprot:scaffold149255_cov19-Tisochrysis_lutea.AAC.1